MGWEGLGAVGGCWQLDWQVWRVVTRCDTNRSKHDESVMADHAKGNGIDIFGIPRTDRGEEGVQPTI